MYSKIVKNRYANTAAASSRKYDKMYVWVKLISSEEQAFKVNFNDEMDFDDLKESIAKKRGIPHSTVQFIYSAEREADNCRKKASATVPEPKKNEIGSSDDFPYFFSLANSEKGDSHLTDDAILLSSFFRILFSSPVYYIHLFDSNECFFLLCLRFLLFF